MKKGRKERRGEEEEGTEEDEYEENENEGICPGYFLVFI